MGQLNFKDQDSNFEEIMLKENRFKLALKNSSIVIAYVDTDLRYRWIYNPHSDYKASQTIGKTDEELNDCKGSEKMMELKRKVINNEKSLNKIIKFELSDGERFYNINCEPFYNNDGEIIGVTTASMDITEYEIMKRRMLRSERFSVVGKLASGVAHEFNNILAVIMGHVQLFLNKNKNNISNEEYKNFELIIDKCKRAKEITYSLFKIASPLEAKKETHDLEKIIDEVFGFFKKDFIQYNIEIVRKYRLNINIKIDMSQMKYIIMNLISNSIHAIIPQKKGKIIIYTYKNEKNIVIIFADTGTGIEEEITNKIFDPFFTTKGGYSKENVIEGTGLGLSVVYKYIQNHDGNIEVKSVKGKGTTMIIKIPFIK